MSTKETIKHQYETGVGGFRLYRECLDKDYVYLTLDFGVPFWAANTADICVEDGQSSIAFRLPIEWARKLGLIGDAQEAVPGSGNVSADLKMSSEREEDVRRGAAMNAHYRLDFLTRSLPMPKWARYVVRCADDCQTVTVVLVTKRKNPQWPNWDEIAPLISCERIVEDVDPDTQCPRKTLHF